MRVGVNCVCFSLFARTANKRHPLDNNNITTSRRNDFATESGRFSSVENYGKPMKWVLNHGEPNVFSPRQYFRKPPMSAPKQNVSSNRGRNAKLRA